MLFIISKDLIQADYYSENKEKIKRAVKNILIGVYESKHLVFAAYDVLAFFEKEISDSDANAVIKYLLSQYSMLNYDIIKRRVLVVPGKEIHVSVDGDNSEIIKLSIDFFQDTKIIQSAVLLSEFDEDAKFYAFVTRYYCDEKDINISLSFDPDNGGGSSIDNRYIWHQKNLDHFCLALVDSDKKYPNCDYGPTKKKLEKANNPNNHLCNYFAIDVHEVENLVPFNYIDEITCIKNENRDKINLIRSNNSSLLKYYDFKKGLVKDPAYASKDDFIQYARDICNLDPSISSFDTYYSSINDGDVIYPGFCRVLKFALPKLLMIGAEGWKKPVLFEFQEKEWERIGSTCLNWLCARNEEALNI